MLTNFEPSLKHVLVHEGGYVDHPRGPGGATMKGVTLAVYQRFFGAERSKDDLRAITDDQLGAIYRDGYWDRTRGDDLPTGVDYIVFDSSVLKRLPTFGTFGKGWSRRLADVRVTALEFAGGDDAAVSGFVSDFETVRLHSKGPWVGKLQEALGVEVDGAFGSGTDAALRAFQSAEGLTPDGVAGRNTWRALGLIG